MKTFTNMAAQGDFVILRIKALPKDAVAVEATTPIIVAHSETGHNHVMERTHVTEYQLKQPDIYTMFLQVDEPTEIVHHRSFDTHEPLLVPPGLYKIARQREHTPEGWRRSAD